MRAGSSRHRSCGSSTRMCPMPGCHRAPRRPHRRSLRREAVGRSRSWSQAIRQRPASPTAQTRSLALRRAWRPSP
eukprot:scaffold95216_cov63-Phaeocystis_antarctica.AAC.3